MRMAILLWGGQVKCVECTDDCAGLCEISTFCQIIYSTAQRMDWTAAATSFILRPFPA